MRINNQVVSKSQCAAISAPEQNCL